MSALARHFLAEGHRVAGYDRVENAQVMALRSQGVDVITQDVVEALPAAFQNPKTTLVVITPAIPPDQRLRHHFETGGFALRKRAAVVAGLANPHYLIAVAGAHGKTTTSICLAFLLWQCGRSVRAFLGGVSADFRSNYVSLGGAEEAIWIVEADEYDRSFLHLKPDIAIVTSTDADHLDVYQNKNGLLKGFGEFAMGIKTGGHLVRYQAAEVRAPRHAREWVYGEGPEVDWHLQSPEMGKGLKDAFRFSLRPGREAGFLPLHMPMPGPHNQRNAAAALCAGTLAGEATEHMARFLTGFSGIERRFDIRFQSRELLYIDDYAHHPSELEAAIITARQLGPGRHLTGVFQPHLYSRTRDFAEGFGEALSKLDRVVLLPIYPARELPLPGVVSEMIAGFVRDAEVLHSRLDTLLLLLERLSPLEVLMTLGAGDIDQIVKPITQWLESRYARS